MIKYIISAKQKSKGFVSSINLCARIKYGRDNTGQQIEIEQPTTYILLTKLYSSTTGLFDTRADAEKKLDELRLLVQKEKNLIAKFEKTATMLLNKPMHELPTKMFLLILRQEPDTTFGSNAWEYKQKYKIVVNRSIKLDYNLYNSLYEYFTGIHIGYSFNKTIKINANDAPRIFKDCLVPVIKFCQGYIKHIDNAIKYIDENVAIHENDYRMQYSKNAYPLKVSTFKPTDEQLATCSSCGYKVPEVSMVNLSQRYFNVNLCPFCAEKIVAEVNKVVAEVPEDIKHLYENQSFTDKI